MIRKLPVGIQTFEEVRKEKYLYVDKTALVFEIASTGKPYFLSRPRRFGKSLLLSTFEAYFQGRKDLFDGLAISGLETEWKRYPILHLDLNARKYETIQDLYAILNQHLEQWEQVYGEEKMDRAPEERFSYVIEQAYLQTGEKVVVLVDEYDKPLLQSILNENLMAEYRTTMKAFYSVLKSSDRYLRFLFLTGVTKFAQISVFSDLNQLNDISMWNKYATICGITKEEMLHAFRPEITLLSAQCGLSYAETVDKLTAQYDGYHFCEDSVGLFNPFSLINALQKSKLDNYWFQTGTPTFLMELLKKSDYDLRLLMEGVEMDSTAFSEYQPEANNPISLLYQSGYLTIKGYDARFGLYRLMFPNEEVKYGFLKFLVPFYTRVNDSEKSFYIGKFVSELEHGEIDAFIERLKVFYAGIPYELDNKNERHYQTIFYLVFRLIGEFVEVEVRSAKGRADAVVTTRDYIYVFEFKLDGSAEEALRQIDEKGYLLPYRKDGRKLVKVGVDFSKEERNVNRYVVG